MNTPMIAERTGSWLARLDACARCIDNAEIPYGAFKPPCGGTIALYKCTACGYRWHTSWHEAA